jgi:hypothetical protein
MKKVLFGRFRLLVTFALAIFGRKPAVVRVEIQWEKSPYSFHVDWFKDSPSDGGVEGFNKSLFLKTRRVKPPVSQ